MRKYLLALAALMVLSACGDDDSDVTNPETDSFTLTVTGSGSGSGRVVSATGVNPAIDCTLVVGSEPSGVCSGTYPEGTVVTLTIASESSTSFNGWSGGAASCATSLSCPITITQDVNAVAQFSIGTAAVRQRRL